jgi:hypothetical protein
MNLMPTDWTKKTKKRRILQSDPLERRTAPREFVWTIMPTRSRKTVGVVRFSRCFPQRYEPLSHFINSKHAALFYLSTLSTPHSLRPVRRRVFIRRTTDFTIMLCLDKHDIETAVGEKLYSQTSFLTSSHISAFQTHNILLISNFMR